jgi:hypothetical protein
MWMIDRIHNDAAYGGAFSHMTRTARFPDGDVLVIEITDLAYGRYAFDIDQPRFPGRKLHVGPSPLFGDKLRSRARASRHLCALTGPKLDVVDGSSQGNILERK